MEALSRVFLGLVALALLLQLSRHGWAGVRDWLAAKFLGHAPARVQGAH